MCQWDDLFFVSPEIAWIFVVVFVIGIFHRRIFLDNFQNNFNGKHTVFSLADSRNISWTISLEKNPGTFPDF